MCEQKPKLLICLNSEQTVQDVIAAKYIQPDRIMVITTTEMKRRGSFQNLRDGLGACGFTVNDSDVIEVPATDFSQQEHLILGKGLGKSEFRNYDLVLNATGGTKPMSFSALQILDFFKKKGQSAEAIYIDSSKEPGAIRFFPKLGEKESFTDPPDLEQQFAAFGWRKQIENDHAELDTLWKWINENFTTANAMFGKLFSGHERIEIRENTNRPMAFFGLLKKYNIVGDYTEEDSFIRWHKGNGIIWDTLIQKSGWLECYTAWLCRTMGADEVYRSVYIFNQRSPMYDRNGMEKPFAEFDVVARKGVHLYFFECKAGYRVHEEGGNRPVPDLLHSFSDKLEVAGGRLAIGVLVTSQENFPLTEFQKLRAERIHMELIDNSVLRNRGRLQEKMRAIFS